MDLTKRQREIYDFIKKHWKKYGYPPTVREIGRAVGLTSSSTVHAHLEKLEKLGILRRDPTKPRALELLLEKAKDVMRSEPSGLPLVGTVAAGQPILAEENIEEYLDVPGFMKRGDNCFVLSVKGESMRDIGILDGDFVVVQQRKTAKNGDIVVALLEDEATVKRFFKEDGRVRLQPENSEMEPIVTTDVELIGRVVGVLRRIQ